MSYPPLRLLPGQDRRPRAGHPWVYSNELRLDAAAKALPPGALVKLVTAEGKALAIAQFNPHSLIAARILSRNQNATIDSAFFERRLARALQLRERLYDSGCYRLVHAEADGLPGLVIDRMKDVLVCQLNSAGMEAMKPVLLQALDAVLAPKTVIWKNDSPVRELEGLPLAVEIARGKVEGPVELEENGLTFLADPLEGQKTGWYFDQQENRAFAARLASGARMLDLYSHSGGFALAALAGGASEALAVDRSALALELAQAAANANGQAERLTVQREEAFTALGALIDAKERFGLVVADPPTFVKNKRELKVGLRGYRKLVRTASQLLGENGFFVVASCSHNVPLDLFKDEVRKGLADGGRGGRLIKQSGAGPDHPCHPMLPESAYLKCLFYALD
jgi:23S rRNA (cytosine1962-C5)-methyltransferase